MKLREMIQRVDEADEAGAYRAQIGGFQRERFEEVLDLLDRFAGGSYVTDSPASRRRIASTAPCATRSERDLLPLPRGSGRDG